MDSSTSQQQQPVLYKRVISNLHELIQLKEKQMKLLLAQNKKDTAEYKAIPFKLKFYKDWYNKLVAITDWPANEAINNLGELKSYLAVLKSKYVFQDSLLTKFQEVYEKGELAELSDLRTLTSNPAPTLQGNPAHTPGNPAHTLGNPAHTPGNPAHTPGNPAHTPGNPAHTPGNPAHTPGNPAHTPGNPAHTPGNPAAVGSQVEAVPKKLALEGERPGDDDPHGQKVYDLRLVHGFGEVNAKEFVDAGCTLEILLSDWAKFLELPESENGLLDKDYIQVPGVDLSRLSPAKVFSIKEAELRNRLSKVSTWLPKLHHDQLVALKYFKDTSQKVPRTEIDKIQKFCQVVAKSLSSEFELMCCGSYRRGRERSGDVDCLLTHRELKTPADIDIYEREGRVIQAIVLLLKKVGFIRDYFAVGETKFMGICRLPDNKNGTYTVFRHIDIRFVPYNSKGTAMLYFTGSFEYNKQMRAKANEKGYMLSEYGIFKYAKDKKGKKIRGEQIAEPFITEEAVCSWLDMPYLEPNQRDI